MAAITPSIICPMRTAGTLDTLNTWCAAGKFNSSTKRPAMSWE